MERIGKVAYRLRLPQTSKLHLVFHVSLLKRKVGNKFTVSTQLPQFTDAGVIDWTLKRVLVMQVIKRKKRTITQWLIE